MATATLKFNLDDPDDAMAFRRASSSTDMALALWEIVYNSRKKVIWEVEAQELKNIENGTDEFVDPVEIFMERIFEVLEEHNINVDKLVQ
jgi:hypothetical protein